MSQSRKPQLAADGGGGGSSIPGSPPPGARPKSPRLEVISARALYFGNGDPGPETALARAISGRVQFHRITDDYVGHVDDSREYYNTLFVTGSDPVRIRKLIRIYRPVLKTKAKIVIIREVRPGVRAQLLNAGFDDVFDGDMSAAEGAARVRAVLGRIAQSRQAKVIEEVRDLHLQHFTREPLLGREARVLSMLVAARGSPVRSNQLAISGRSTHRPISTKSLQVLISGLRAKLHPNLRIVSQGPAGYSLQEISPARSLLDSALKRT